MDESSVEGDSTTTESSLDDAEMLPDDIDGLLLDSSSETAEVFSDGEIFEITDPSMFGGENFPTLIIGDLIDRLSDERLIVIAGEVVDKRAVARAVAWEFSQARRDFQGEELNALEYKQSDDSRGLLQKMDATTSASVFVLTDVEPHQFGGTLNRFFQATRGNHYLVLTTERPKHTWLLNERAERSWFEPLREALYTPGSLCRYLEERVLHYLSEKGDAPEIPQDVSVNSRSWAEALGTPESIDYFVFEYVRYQGQLDDNSLAQLLSKAINPPELVAGWFVNQLTAREQTVAIALALIDGMDEISAFEVLEKLMNDVWQKRDSTFRFIDYGDLQNLRDHFIFDQNNAGVARIHTRGSDTRHHILKAAWSTHRRQIIAALQSLLILARESISGKQSLSAFRVRSVRRQFRTTISRAIGDTARLSLGAVEPLLLTLVADGRVASYLMLGDSLGQLRASGENPDAIFEMLQRWRGQGELHRFLAARLDSSGIESVEIMMGSAVSVVLGRLALSDDVDNIHPTIIELMQSYCSSEKLGIINVLSHYTLPQLVSIHPVQMRELLPDLFERVGTDPVASKPLVVGTGAGLGLSVLAGNVGASNLIKSWIKKGLINSPASFDDTIVNMREKTMAAGLYALSVVKQENPDESDYFGSVEHSSAAVLDSDDDLLNAMGAGLVLAKVLNREKHPAVREAALTSVNNLLSKEFNSVVMSFESLLSALSPEERHSVLSSIVQFHQRQRSMQKGGDAVVRIKNREYPIWYDRNPPTTAIQKKVFDWASNAKEERLAAFAGDAVMSIRREHERTEELEKETLKQQRENELEAARNRKVDASERHIGHHLTLSFLQRVFVVPVATRGLRSQRAAVAGQLAVATGLSKEEQTELIDRYNVAGKKELALGLERALLLDKNKWKFILGGVFLVYMLIAILAN